MPAKLKVGQRYIVGCTHPNIFETEIPVPGRQIKATGLMRSGGGIRTVKELARFETTWIRLYEGEFVDRDPHDSCPRYKPIRRLRVSCADLNEVPDDGSAPGFEDVARFIKGEDEVLMSPNERNELSAGPKP